MRRVGENGVADGFLIDRRGRMYVTAREEDALKIREPGADWSGRPAVLVQDRRLRWPDTLAEGPDGSVYVTASRIQDSAWFRPENGARLPARLWRVTP